MFRHTYRISMLLMAVMFFSAAPAFAHFQVILPGDNMVAQDENRNIPVSLLFTHPFEQHPMNMEKPVAFGVMARGEKADLLPRLEEFYPAKGLKAWKTGFELHRPGDHIFFVEPVPYWEPAEGKYIIHYTKTVVNAFGMEEGWDEPVGLRAEVLPLTRPYGLWEGNVFQGKVIVDGKPVADADVEVEYYNADSARTAPADPLVTQVVRTDENGIFTYAMPWAGWWGFAALTDAPETMKSPSDEDVPIELGAVIWVRAEKIPQ